MAEPEHNKKVWRLGNRPRKRKWRRQGNTFRLHRQIHSLFLASEGLRLIRRSS